MSHSKAFTNKNTEGMIISLLIQCIFMDSPTPEAVKENHTLCLKQIIDSFLHYFHIDDGKATPSPNTDGFH